MTTPIRTLVVTGLFAALLAAPASAAGPASRTFPASADRVWTTTLAVLKVMGWDIDKEERAIGYITTDSRSVDGEDYGVYFKGVRHRLTVNVKAEGAERATVTIQRDLFKRERIVFVNKDEPLTATDQKVETALLDAIGKAL